MTKNAFDSRRWVLPLAALAPLMAIAFAFSLGPSPRKRLQVIYQAETVDVSALAKLADLGPPMYEALTEDVQRADSPHREAIIKFLGDRNYTQAAPAMRRLVTTPTETQPVRAAALRALKKINPEGLRDLAKSLTTESGALGQAARQLLAELSSGQS